ncbi:MAG: hypothetical protein ACK44W_16505, partial [Planctomycetota bacterium]
MLDVKFIAENPEAVRENARRKNERRADVDAICRL